MWRSLSTAFFTPQEACRLLWQNSAVSGSLPWKSVRFANLQAVGWRSQMRLLGPVAGATEKVCLARTSDKAR